MFSYIIKLLNCQDNKKAIFQLQNRATNCQTAKSLMKQGYLRFFAVLFNTKYLHFLIFVNHTKRRFSGKKTTAGITPTVEKTFSLKLFSAVLFEGFKFFLEFFRKLVTELAVEFLNAFGILCPKRLVNVKN